MHTPAKKSKNQHIKQGLILVITFIVIICGLLLWPRSLKTSHPVSLAAGSLTGSAKLSGKTDTSAAIVKQPDTVSESAKALRRTNIARSLVKSKTIVLQDTRAGLNDSTLSNRSEDTLKKMTNPCAGDTIKPWVYPDPSGGLHRKQIRVRFFSEKPARIKWRFAGGTQDQEYDGDSIPITQSCKLIFSAIDSCGNVMEERQESYEISLDQRKTPCPDEMEFISVGQTKFCIDRYEWPGKKGALPQAFISLYLAGDSCASLGKRLCSTEEWRLACAGPYQSRFPYGQTYERHACVTEDSVVRPAGSRPECRGHFEVFDMSGNLMEWTNTRSSANRSFYNVMGGFFKSGPESYCAMARYSYFPQNRHNPVGFRCCKDTALTK
jgi:hypothetical protein